MAHGEFGPEVREKLLQWFHKYGPDPNFEIEARIRDITEVGFNNIHRTLSSANTWSNRPMPEDTLDQIRATGVRETSGSQGSTFLRKQKHEHMDVMTTERSVRFAVSSELKTGQDTSPIRTYRYKQRTTFEHKRAFKFELTRVKQGDSLDAARQSDLVHEIEVSPIFL